MQDEEYGEYDADQQSAGYSYDTDQQSAGYDTDQQSAGYDTDQQSAEYNADQQSAQYDTDQLSAGYDTGPKTSEYYIDLRTPEYGVDQTTADYNADQPTEDFTSSDVPDDEPDEDLYEETTHKVVYRRSSFHLDLKGSENEEERNNTRQSNPFSRSNEEGQWRSSGLPDRSSRSWPERRGEFEQRFHRSTNKSDAYYAVGRYQVDYNNKNYIRSMLNKPGGFHRYAVGREMDWDIEYDNTYYLRSKVNEPKGLHRLKGEIKRKLVPDDDFLADSTGWVMEYGPAFKQKEGDVPYMPEDRMVARGAYRHYGVRRNDSDSDRKLAEKQLEFPEIDVEQFKYGPEFRQKDVPHILKQKDQMIGRGSYRFYEADRNFYDERPLDPPGLEYRESRATLGEPSGSQDVVNIPKGKPFKRTILKKIVKLGKPISRENVRYRGQQIHFTPGEGSRTFYEGTPFLRVTSSEAKTGSSADSRTFYVGQASQPGYSSRRNQSASTYKTQNERSNRRYGKQSKENEYRQNDYGNYSSQRAKTRRQDDRGYSNQKTNRKRNEDTDYEKPMDEKEVLKKFPPDVEQRIYAIRKRMSKPEIASGKDKGFRKQQTQGKSQKGGRDMLDRDLKDFDFKKHLNHPRDHGKSTKGGYEKYTNKNGSEIWVKTEENYVELHHM